MFGMLIHVNYKKTSKLGIFTTYKRLNGDKIDFLVKKEF